ncbi:MAG: hypothetical protein SVZ03_05940 [Spirochaetota bacterium]|nr:hypothetical protein [Spirochaetota bacterium]
MKKLCLSIVVLFLVFAVTGISIAEDFDLNESSDKKMLASGGLGFSYPLGDAGDWIDYSIPLLLSFQYEVNPAITIEGDFYYDLLISEATDLWSNFQVYQIGVGARYWLSKDFKEGSAFDAIYIGAGLAITKLKWDWEMESYMPVMTTIPTYPYYDYTFVPYSVSYSADESFTTFVVKGGYVIPLEGDILIDIGGRIDVIDLSLGDWLPFTIYGSVCYNF